MRSRLALLALVPVLGVPMTAAAAEALEEVIVTAEKRAESLQDTPISLVSLSTEKLQRLGVGSVGDLAYHVPNLSMTPFPNSPNAPRLFIRGVGSGDPQVTTDTSVGVYLDGVYLARSIGLGLELADIERVEVLRGPQGTLYGRNTTGGAVNIVTRRPGDALSFTQELGFGQQSLFRSRTSLDVPLSDTLRARASFVVSRRDGPVENLGVGDDFGSYDKRGARVDLRWLAGSAVTADYSFDRSTSDFTSHYYQLLVPNGFFQGVLPVVPGRLDAAALPNPVRPGESTTQGHTLTVAVATRLGELKSITAYRELDESAYQDYSANPFVSVFRNLVAETGQNQLSQELQLVGATDSGSLDYALGLYYFRERGRVNLVDEIGLIGLTLPAKQVSAENQAWAGYAQATWRPSQEGPWSMTLGGRYSRDDRKALDSVSGRVSKSFGKFTPSLTVDYALSDEALLYAKAVSGYKSGGFNIRAADFRRPFDPETLTSYEIGWKTEWLDRRLRLNGAVFYADYKDIQLDIVVPNQPNPALTQTENAGKASIAGAEIELEALLADSLRASVSYGRLDTRIKEVIGDDKRFWVLQNAPDNQVSASLDWRALQWSKSTLNLAADFTYRDPVFTSSRPNPPGVRGDFIPAYGLANITATLRGEDWIGRGQFELSAWVHNAFDREYQIEGQGSFYQLHATRLGSYGDPRLFGVNLKYTY